MKIQYISEISIKIYKHAAENFTKKSEFLYDHEVKLLKTKKEILEDELQQKKKEWEQEKEILMEKLEKTEKEKGFKKIHEFN